MSGAQDIEFDEDGVVDIELDGKGSVVEAEVPEKEDDSVVEVQPEKKPRVRENKTELVKQHNEAITKATEALAEAQRAQKEAEDARRAAELTANAERQRAEQASRVAQQRDEEIKGYQTQVADRELAIINNGIEAAKRELDAAQQEQQRAWEAGEFEKAAAAGGRMARAGAALDRFETDKSRYENRPKQPERTYGQQDYQPHTSNNIEGYLSSVQDPKSQSWLRLHPECIPPQFGGDAAAHGKAIRGHHKALAEGVTVGSPDYFKIIEETVGLRQAATSAASVVKKAEVEDDDQDAPVPQRKAPQRQAIPSAPVTRDTPTGVHGVTKNGGKISVRLSPQQQEIALFSFAPKDGESDTDYRRRAFNSYASELAKLTEEGKMGRMHI